MESPDMTEPASLGFPEAAARLGVSLRVLRHAIRAGKIPAPAENTAVARLSPEWLANAESALQNNPGALKRAFPQKAPPFARYVGTSAWRKYAVRVRAHARFHAAEKV
jgi:hypothetical protein